MAFFQGRAHHPDKTTRDYAYSQGSITSIGRSDGNDIVLEDPVLKPTHANVMRQGGHATPSRCWAAATCM